MGFQIKFQTQRHTKAYYYEISEHSGQREYSVSFQKGKQVT